MEDKRYFCSMRCFRILCLVLFVCFSQSVDAQTGNPFDMEHKASSSEKWEKPLEVSLPAIETSIESANLSNQAATTITKDQAATTITEDTGNPFEMEDKVSTTEQGEEFQEVSLPEKQPEVEDLIQSEPTVFAPLKVEGNPFDIGSKSEPVASIKAPSSPVVKKKRRVVGNTDSAKINRFKLILTIILLVALALISTLLRHVILKVFEGFKSDNLLRTYFRVSGRRITPPNMLLELFFILNASFTVFLLLEYYNYLGNSPFFEFLVILLFLLVVVYGKHLLLFIIKEVFPIKKEVSEYNFTINVFLSVLGFILMPCNLILAYAPEAMATFTLYFVGASTSLVLGLLAFRSLLIGSKYLSTNRFHFFMYLCSVEIAPIFILFKVVKNYLGS